jgi:hypothetical protein
VCAADETQRLYLQREYCATAAALCGHAAAAAIMPPLPPTAVIVGGNGVATEKVASSASAACETKLKYVALLKVSSPCCFLLELNGSSVFQQSAVATTACTAPSYAPAFE